MNAACAVCRTTTEPLTASGLCGTCQSQASETKPAPPDEFAPTVSREPALDTHSADSGTPTESPLPPGGYELLENIGVGGMGQVWRARRLSTRQIVAIKKLLPERFSAAGFKRFAAEAKAVAQVDHKNVVRLLDFVPDPADPFLVLEFVDGQNLTEHVKQARQFNPRRAARLLADACAGIQAANDKGIVHRDLKPGNILLTADGVVKITDFGLVKSILDPTDGSTAGPGDADALDTLTRTGQSAGGTPGFMAPEQADVSFADIDRRTDVYGLGATLFALLLGRAPFPGGKENMRRVFTDPVPVPHDLDPQVPRDLSLIVVKCLQKRPADRYPTAAALAADLTAYLNGDSTTVNPHGWARRQWRRAGKLNRGWWVAAGLLLLTVGTGIGLAMVPKRKAPDPLAEVQGKLQAEQEQDLVEGAKPRLPVRWLLSDAVLSEPTADEPRLTFAPRQRAMLVLMADPGIDRYRIVARLQHLKPPADAAAAFFARGGSLGVFVGYREGMTPAGHLAKAYTALEFNDQPPDPAKPRPSHLAVFERALLQSPLRDPRQANSPVPEQALQLENEPIPFVIGPEERWPLHAGEELPGPVRNLVLDVSPEGVTISCPPLADIKVIPAAEISRRYFRLEEQLCDKTDGRPLGTQNWSPRSPVGVFADRCPVAVERFVLQPLPPK